jgi:hypothetical protein
MFLESKLDFPYNFASEIEISAEEIISKLDTRSGTVFITVFDRVFDRVYISRRVKQRDECCQN